MPRCRSTTRPPPSAKFYADSSASRFGGLGARFSLVQHSPAPEKTWQSERTDPVPGPVNAASFGTQTREGKWQRLPRDDSERVKRWGKELLGAQEAGTRRFNPPPGWPSPPAGWVAPPGWQPDPSWPKPPPGWQLWVEDRPAISPKAQDALLAMAGGIGIVLGSLMPWVSFNSAGVEVKPGAKAASVILGLLVVALGFALRAALYRGGSRRYRGFVPFFPGGPAVRGFHADRHPRSSGAGPVR